MPVTVILFARAIPRDFLAAAGDAARRTGGVKGQQIEGCGCRLITGALTDVKLGLHTFPLPLPFNSKSFDSENWQISFQQPVSKLLIPQII